MIAGFFPGMRLLQEDRMPTGFEDLLLTGVRVSGTIRINRTSGNNTLRMPDDAVLIRVGNNEYWGLRLCTETALPDLADYRKPGDSCHRYGFGASTYSAGDDLRVLAPVCPEGGRE